MWAQIINMLLGIWLMVAPQLLNYSKQAADNAHIVGPVITTFAIISLTEATRNVRWYNIPPGVWLLLAPWILNYENGTAIFNDMVVGLLVIIFAFIKGKVSHQFGGGWRSLWKSDAPHLRKSNLN